jgi:AcrR family transcriptional regulator
MSAKSTVATDGRSRPRKATDQKIEAAVRDIVTTLGPQAVTIDKVSEVSGVARTTLYRRYRNKYDLLQGVAEQIAPTIPDEPEISLTGFTHVLEDFQRVFTAPGMSQLISHMMTADDEFMKTWKDQLIGPRTAVITDFLSRGAQEGILQQNANDGVITELILGALIAAALVHGQIADDWAQTLAKRLWPLIVA